MAQPSTSDVGDEPVTDNSGRNISWAQLVAAGIMGLIIGGVLALMFSNIGGSGIVFLVGLVGGTYYLYQKPLPSAAVGTGLYISAALLVLTPIIFYVPMFMGAEEGTAEGAGQAVGSVLGLLIWGFVFFLIGLVVFVTGYFVNRRARRKLEKKEGEPASATESGSNSVTP